MPGVDLCDLGLARQPGSPDPPSSASPRSPHRCATMPCIGAARVTFHCVDCAAALRQQRLGWTWSKVYARGRLRPDEAADLPAEQRGKNRSGTAHRKFACRHGANEKSVIANRDQRQHGDGSRIDPRASGRRPAWPRFPPPPSPVQLSHEGAVVAVLRRHQGRRLPAGRENRKAAAAGIVDVRRETGATASTPGGTSTGSRKSRHRATARLCRRCATTIRHRSVRTGRVSDQRRLEGVADRAPSAASSPVRAADLANDPSHDDDRRRLAPRACFILQAEHGERPIFRAA